MSQSQLRKSESAESSIVLLFREVARQLAKLVWLLNGRRPHIDPDVLEKEHHELQIADEELRRRYPDAKFRMSELQQRARERGVWVSPFITPEQLAALLDYLDDPQRLEPLGPISSRMAMIALNTLALNADGRTCSSMAYAVNRARYQLVCDQARRANTQDEYYNDERAGWSIDQWLADERRDKQVIHSTGSRNFKTGECTTIKRFADGITERTSYNFRTSKRTVIAIDERTGERTVTFNNRTPSRLDRLGLT